MMNHIEGDLFAAYIDGELEESRRHEVTSHLDTCAACAGEMERFQEVKIRYSRMPRRPAPPELLAKLDHLRSPRPRWYERWIGVGALPPVWRPVAVFAAIAAFVVAMLVGRANRNPEFVDLDSLLVAHSKYQAESLVPHPDMAQSNYSARLASFYRDEE
jgi:anti-sigma factor RsiW